MLQLLCSGAVLVVAIAVKLLMPDVLAEYRARLLALLGTDTDFVEVFSAAGRAFSSEGAIGGALNDAYTAVFGPSVPAETPTPTAAVYTPDAQPANTELLQRVLGFAYASPVTGQLSSGFGLRTDPLEGGRRFHYGLDIAAEEGTVVSSFADGTVTAVGESSELGRYVTVSHPNGYATLYAHCTRITASSMQEVIRLSRLELGDWVLKKEFDAQDNPYLHMYVEIPPEAQGSEVTMRTVLTEHLALYFQYFDSDYGDLKKLLSMEPLQITVLKYGTIAAYESRLGQTLTRVNPGMLDIMGLLKQQAEPSPGRGARPC